MKTVVVGDCFIDIEAPIGDNLPSWGGDCRCRGPILPHPGGSALNTACQLATISADMSVELYSALGSDTWAQVLQSHCSARGVSLHHETINDVGTGTCIVLSGPKDRCFVTNYGAVAEFQAKHFLDKLLSSPPIDVLHIAGYFSTTKLQEEWPSVIRNLKAKNPDMVVCLDTNYDAAEKWGRDTPVLDELLELVDVFIPNQDEALGISEQATVDAALEKLSEKVGTVVITKGAGGCVAKQSGKSSVACPAPLVDQVVSTVGAGDSFKAAFLHAFSQKWELGDVLRFACAAGAIAIGHVGACDHALTRQEIQQLVDAEVTKLRSDS